MDIGKQCRAKPQNAQSALHTGMSVAYGNDKTKNPFAIPFLFVPTVFVYVLRDVVSCHSNVIYYLGYLIILYR